MERPRYFLNPNAAPAALYPLIPLLIAFDNDVAIWQPEEKHIEEYLNPNWWGELLNHSVYRDRIHIFSAEWRAKSYGNSGLNSAISERLSADSANSVRPDSFKRVAYEATQILWDQFLPERRAQLEAAMIGMRDDLSSSSPEVLIGLSKTASDYNRCDLWALFDSVVQDLYMVGKSGAHFPFCKPSCWGSYNAVVDALNSLTQAPREDSKASKSFQLAADIVSRLAEARPPTDVEPGQSSSVYAGRLVSYVADINKIALPEFIDRRAHFRAEVKDFKSFETAALSAPRLRGNLVDRAIQVQTELKERRESALASADVIAAALELVALGLEFKKDADLAAKTLAVVAGAAGFSIQLFKHPVLAKPLKILLGSLTYRSLHVNYALRNPDFWTSLHDDKYSL